MKGHQAQNGNSDCDGRNQNPSPPLPILPHLDTILAFSIQILAMRDGRISALALEPINRVRTDAHSAAHVGLHRRVVCGEDLLGSIREEFRSDGGVGISWIEAVASRLDRRGSIMRRAMKPHGSLRLP